MKNLFILATAVFALASCSNNETVENDGPVELRLSSGIEVQQARSNTQSTEILEGETVYGWLDEAPSSGAATAYSNAWKLTAGQSGALNGNAMFFPESGNGVDVYALHGNFPTAFTEGTTAFPTSLIHAVEADQSPQNAGMKNYAKSDLLYAIRKGVTRAGASDKNVKTENLTFYHLLSKVEVALKSGDGTPGLGDAVVTIENTKLKTAFKPAKDADMAATADDAGQKARAAMLTLPTAGNDVQPITIGNATTADFNSTPTYNEAIVVPQVIGSGAAANFIKVQLKDKAALYYQVTGLTLESGKKYTYHITVNLTGLTVTSTIEDWKAVGDKPTEGNAEMQ